MTHFPDRDTFDELARRADLVPVYRRLLGDFLTPLGAFLKIDCGASACLFESVVGGENVGRYSFLTAGPFLQFEARGTQVTIRADDDVRRFDSPDPIEELRRQVHAIRTCRVEGLPPFVSGAVGYAGYDAVRYSERLPNAPPDDRQLPDMAFAFYDRMIVFDNINKTLIVVAMARTGAAGSSSQLVAPETAYRRACQRVDETIEVLARPGREPACADIELSGPPTLGYTSNFSQTDFESAVRRCVDYIHAGDIFQVVISQRLAVPVDAHPLEIYRTLRVVNPSPFMFYLRTPDVTLVGSSPEIMVRVVEGRVTVRPLAGTRPRGKTESEDQRLAAELLADPKERAEHVMLVDLGRNDVGRVSQFGSVCLTDVMTVERYSHVMHITSNVTGQLRDESDAFDALRACLPAGTVSGAPKVRAMEIIDELEPHRRGPYAGAVGYIDFSGNMDTCIALRTIVVQNGTAYVQAGAGIVADSVPEREYQETLNKACGLLKAIEITAGRTCKDRSLAR